jgi:hypothetical protein
MTTSTSVSENLKILRRTERRSTTPEKGKRREIRLQSSMAAILINDAHQTWTLSNWLS